MRLYIVYVFMCIGLYIAQVQVCREVLVMNSTNVSLRCETQTNGNAYLGIYMTNSSGSATKLTDTDPHSSSGLVYLQIMYLIRFIHSNVVRITCGRQLYIDNERQRLEYFNETCFVLETTNVLNDDGSTLNVTTEMPPQDTETGGGDLGDGTEIGGGDGNGNPPPYGAIIAGTVVVLCVVIGGVITAVITAVFISRQINNRARNDGGNQVIQVPPNEMIQVQQNGDPTAQPRQDQDSSSTQLHSSHESETGLSYMYMCDTKIEQFSVECTETCTDGAATNRSVSVSCNFAKVQVKPPLLQEKREGSILLVPLSQEKVSVSVSVESVDEEREKESILLSEEESWKFPLECTEADCHPQMKDFTGVYSAQEGERSSFSDNLKSISNYDAPSEEFIEPSEDLRNGDEETYTRTSPSEGTRHNLRRRHNGRDDLPRTQCSVGNFKQPFSYFIDSMQHEPKSAIIGSDGSLYMGFDYPKQDSSQGTSATLCPLPCRRVLTEEDYSSEFEDDFRTTSWKESDLHSAYVPSTTLDSFRWSCPTPDMLELIPRPVYNPGEFRKRERERTPNTAVVIPLGLPKDQHKIPESEKCSQVGDYEHVSHNLPDSITSDKHNNSDMDTPPLTHPEFNKPASEQLQVNPHITEQSIYTNSHSPTTEPLFQLSYPPTTSQSMNKTDQRSAPKDSSCTSDRHSPKATFTAKEIFSKLIKSKNDFSYISKLFSDFIKTMNFELPENDAMLDVNDYNEKLNNNCLSNFTWPLTCSV